MSAQLGNQITLATRVTILRILGVPVFVFLVIHYTLGLANGTPSEMYRYAALVVFILVAATDALDGYLARSRNEVTRLGKILDPLADKALVLSGLLLLTQPSLAGLKPYIPVGYTLLIISRDLVLVMGAIVVHMVAGHVEIHARWIGKISTICQMIIISWVLLRGAQTIFNVMIWIAGMVAFSAGMVYLFDGLKQMEKSPEEE